MSIGSEIYTRIKRNAPTIMERFSRTDALFNPQDVLPEQEYVDFFDENLLEFKEALEELLTLWESTEHRQTMGHDRVHMSFDMYELLELVFHANLPRSEQYLTLFGSLLHDLGRYPEVLFQEKSLGMDFTKSKEIQLHAALSGYLAVLIARNHQGEKNLPAEQKRVGLSFNRRVIGAVLFHGGRNEERDPVALHVQTVDRLAGILGVREFVRNIVCDGVQRGASIYPDENLDYSHNFPRFNNLPVTNFMHASSPENSWTNILHYIEMPMRNIFPLSCEYATRRSVEMRRQSGIILTLLSGGRDTELYHQIFSPELSDDKHDYSFPKTLMSEELWTLIKNGPTSEERLEMEKLNSLNIDQLIDLMLQQQAPDISDDDREKTHKMVHAVPATHASHIRDAITYVVARRKMDTAQERHFLETASSSEDQLISTVAKRLLESGLFDEV